MSNKVKILTLICIGAICALIILIGSTVMQMLKGTDDKNNTVATNEIQNEVVQNTTNSTEIKESEDVEVVATLLDKVEGDVTWCGSFQIVWNELKAQFARGDVNLDPKTELADRLNKESFKEADISPEYYYKKVGKLIPSVRREIEENIKAKFNQNSDILDKIRWNDENPNIREYILYTMLYRKFEFNYVFDVLEKSKFGEYDNVEYFGTKNSTKDFVKKQVNVIYYNNENDFAVYLTTNKGDEVVYCKNPEGKTFDEIYSNMMKKGESYAGDKKLQENENFKAPKLSINVFKEYEDLENKTFKGRSLETNDVVDFEIMQALQTVKFSIDEKGGEVKSEAVITAKELTAMIGDEKEIRQFNVDDTFTLFIREAGRNKPYFAVNVQDITKFQE